MSLKYPNLLSPIKIGNVIFKNRLTASPFRAKFVQGEEPYPTEAMITHHVNKARNGAAWVTCGALEAPVKIEAQKLFGDSTYVRYRVLPQGEMGSGQFIGLLEHASNQESYLTQMTEAVHFYGSKAAIGIMPTVPRQFDASAGVTDVGPFAGNSSPRNTQELPVDLMETIADEYALKAAFVKDLGFDGLFIHMCYRNGILGRFISPMTNKRTDQFGGGPANRVRFPIMVADRIKQKCGSDFILEAGISAVEEYPGGQTLEDTIAMAKLLTGHFDILQLRAGDIVRAHPTGFNPERTPYVQWAEAVKNSGTGIAVLTIGGYLDLGICENVIASGKADFIGMARSWVSNPDYGRKAYEGRGDDVVPCIRCERCHTSSYADPIASVCSVNPTWGFEHKIARMIDPPGAKQKVAVVGGGPGGMETALVATRRGHRVTLYEKSDALGGLLNISENVSFKWPLKQYRNYLLYQIKKANIDIRLDTEVTADILKAEKYDAIFAAMGGQPIMPDIPGISRKNVFAAEQVFDNEDALSKDVVIVGGGETGVETGLYLAEKVHNVTVLEKGTLLVPKATPAHYYFAFKERWEKLKNFKYILHAECVGIDESEVIYVNAEGKKESVTADTVVIAVGYRPKNDLAMKLAVPGVRFFIVGDCNKVGNVQTVIRSAYSNACLL